MFPDDRIVTPSADDNSEIQAALEEGAGTVRLTPGEFNIDQAMVFRHDRTELVMAPGTIVRHHGPAEAFRFTNTSHCRMVLSQLLCHHDRGSGVVFRQSSAPGEVKHCRHNEVARGRIVNVTGRIPVKMQPSEVESRGVYFRHSGNSGVEGYFNRVDGVEIDGFDACIELGQNANAQMLSRINFETAWYGLLCMSHDNTITNAFWHETSGRDGQRMECIRVGDGSYPITGNCFSGLSMEPGPLAWGVWLDQQTVRNLVVCTPNLHDGQAFAVNDLGTNNKVVLP